MPGPWERTDVSDWPLHGVEQIGSTQNVWLKDPDSERIWLHKDTVIPANGIEQGEDWAEVISTQIAMLLGVPCAVTHLCTRNDRRGSISMSVVPEGHSLWEGWVILESAQVPGYFRHSEGSPALDPNRPDVKRPGHSLLNIREALRDAKPPNGFGGPDGMTGFDVFAGYMLLDALIANRDRHEQNWAVLMPSLLAGEPRLAPSYDHCGGLGYNLQDSRREACLRDKENLVRWAEKGTAHRFEHAGSPPTLVAHAVEALNLSTEMGARWWQERIHTCSLTPVEAALEDHLVPEMSEVSSSFVEELVRMNLRRLRNAIDEHS